MKNYQFIVISVLVVGLGAYLFFKDKKKCSCSDHASTIADEVED